MTDTTSGGSEALSAARLEQFADEVNQLRVTGGAANPERQGALWGVGLLVVGGIAAVVGLIMGLGGGTNDKLDGIAVGASEEGANPMDCIWARLRASNSGSSSRSRSKGERRRCMAR